jgi:hypothetical protein
MKEFGKCSFENLSAPVVSCPQQNSMYAKYHTHHMVSFDLERGPYTKQDEEKKQVEEDAPKGELSAEVLNE